MDKIKMLAELQALREEVVALRKDAERYAFVRDQMRVANDSDEHGRWFSSVELKDGFIYPPGSPYYETVNQAIDAAIGARA